MAEKSLKGTRTLGNLIKAFAGESQARGRYNMFAEVAEREGFMRIAEVFNETADNERIHVKIFYDHAVAGLEGEEFPVALHVDADYPVVMGNTYTNLVAAAMGENEEWTELYPEFARIADEEGFPKVAASFRMIVDIEKDHEERYRTLAEHVKAETVFKREDKELWKCMCCGYIFDGSAAPNICPVCKQPKAFFKLHCERF